MEAALPSKENYQPWPIALEQLMLAALAGSNGTGVVT